MEPNDESLGGAFGLGRVLADSGIDTAAFSSLYSKTSGEAAGPSTSAFDDVDAASEKHAAYEDDVSDSELPAESVEEIRAREARKAEEERWYQRAVTMQAQAESSRGQEERERKKKERERDDTAKVKNLWPEFVQGKRLKLSEVFYETPRMKTAWAKELERKRRRKLDKIEYPFKVAPRTDLPPQSVFLQQFEDLPHFDSSAPKYETPIGSYFDSKWVKAAEEARRREMTKPPAGLDLVFRASSGYAESPDDEGNQAVINGLDMMDWEENIILSSLVEGEDKVWRSRPNPIERDPLAPHNHMLDTGEWIKDVIWDARRVSPGLLQSDEEMEDSTVLTASTVVAPSGPASKLDPYNVSNDHLYERSRESRYRIRQTFGAIEVFHSTPAKALQMPFYKTVLSKAEARAWRRPALQFPTGITLSFSKLKSNPSASVRSKKKALMADPAERFKSTKDLSMSEKGPYVLLEFSEEYPPTMSGYGMGTTMINYYRKKDDRDEHVPKLDFGQPSILNVGDAEPFFLSYVDRGKVTTVIHNNLIRAPIYRHQPETSDFLVIRQTINGHASYYLRAINNLYTVGQTVPNESEVPGPHARKNTNTAKQRLMIAAWLLMQKNKQGKLKLTKLLRYFPDQSELQLRQRLKIKGNEFMVYARKEGPNQGFWQLNPEYDFPKTRKEVLERCTPEAAMLYEAMQVGARHLHDAGYSKTAEGKEDDEFADEAGLDVEQQLAVWSTTLNYKKAEAQKAWLTIHGAGDPTGRGEGFSFLTTNMKGYFLRRGETDEGRRIEAEIKADGGQVKISNAAQQLIYEEEKRKVWDLQQAALNDPTPPELTAEDELEKPVSTPAGFGSRFGRSDSRRAMSRGNSMVATPMESPGSPSAFSADGDSTYTGNVGAGKVLRIRRVIKGKAVMEIIRDPAVIKSYMKRIEEKKLAYYMDHPDELLPSGDAEEDEIKMAALRATVDKFKKNQLRRLARKQSIKGILPSYEPDDEAGRRRCGACGQIGHTRANRHCPKFNANTAPSPVGTTPGATPGMYGLGYGPSPHETSMPPPSTEGSTVFKLKLGGGS